MNHKADILFEVSWEVCNKVGGIYTVVKSKAAKMTEIYGTNYFLVGPYFASKAIGEFQEEVPQGSWKHAFEELKAMGIVCHFGKWLIEGSPNVILVDFMQYKGKINDIKTELWSHFQIDSLNAPYDYDEPVSWAYAVGIMIEKLAKSTPHQKIAAQFHEWLAGAGLLYLKSKKAKVATIFTTHATVLGRSLASSDRDLYNIWNKIDVSKEIYVQKVESKHLLEKNSATHADAFTTVSEITGMEASFLLGKAPDKLLPNGLDISKFPTFEELAIKHKFHRDKIREFLLYYFFPYYTFDVKETLTFFIAARYEYHDKGIDVYLKALSKLNQMLKEAKSRKTVIAFIWVPSNYRNIKTELLENKTLYKDITDSIDEVMDDVKKDIIYSFASHRKITTESLFDEKFLTEMKIKMAKFVKKGKPPISTHDLYDDNDQILNGIREVGLLNGEEDRVKIVYYPIYLSGADSLLDLSYYEAMQGSHLGVFPSYYEPWGYTPLEAGALGVPSVTTDLAGFGRYFFSESQKHEMPGIFIQKRLNVPDDKVVDDLSKIMLSFASMARQERVANKMQARNIAAMADWKSFITNYIEAHNMAIDKVY